MKSERPGAATTPAEAREPSELDALRERLRMAELRLRGLQEIGQVGHMMSSGSDLARVLEEIKRRTTALMDCERATLYLASGDGRTLVATIEAANGPMPIELELGQGLAGWVAEHGRAVNLKDAYRDPRFDPRFDQLTGFRTGSVLSQPVLDRHERPLGVVQVLNKRGGYFTTDDEALLETIAIQAAVVIRSARVVVDFAEKHHALLEAQVRLAERNSEMDLMFAIERAAAVARDLDEGLEGALQATIAEYPCDAAAVILLDEQDATETPPESRRWRVRRSTGSEATSFTGRTGMAMEPLLREPLVFGRPLVLFDDPVLSALPPLLAPLLRIETLVLMPLLWRGRDHDDGSAEERTLGALMLVNSRRFPKGFDELDLHKLGVIASRLALSVMLSRAFEEERKAERMAAIGGALSGIVHDLRTPLTLLDGYARLLAREESAAERQALRDRHKRQIEVVNGMIHDVLAFARGQSQVLPRKVWLRDFFNEVEEMLAIELAGSPVQLVVETPYKGGVRMDEAKMKRVLTNLARNAREAMGESGGELRITAVEHEGRVVLRVSDTGPGIPPEMEGRLFKSFATHGKVNGTGLGLAIAKTIIDQHEGTLAVESTPGRGTTFVIGLPAA